MSELIEVLEKLESASPGPWSFCGETRGKPCICGLVWAGGEDPPAVAEFSLADREYDGHRPSPEVRLTNVEAVVAAVNWLRANADRLRDIEVAVAQAVEFAEYVERQAKGAMVGAAKRFLSSPYSEELRERLNHRHSGGDGEGVFWRPGSQRPEPMTCDETGCTIGLVLVIHAPDDGGPNIRQGRYDHCLLGFFDSMTSQRIDPDQWTFAPTEEAARAGERGVA